MTHEIPAQLNPLLAKALRSPAALLPCLKRWGGLQPGGSLLTIMTVFQDETAPDAAASR